MSADPFLGQRAVGCVTYLREGEEIVLRKAGDVELKWNDSTPLMIARIGWDSDALARTYVLRDSRGTERVVSEGDLINA